MRSVDTLIHEVILWITRGIEVVGVSVILVGAIVALARLAGERGGGDAFTRLRSDLGRSILLGLEFLVAADIIATVAVEPTPRSVLVLGAIVLIRTFLSWSLEVEIEGRWPWRRAVEKSNG